MVAGAGLAGAVAAFHLSQTYRVLVLEADVPASGASGLAAGIANPLMSLWARPVWRMEEAVAALEELIEAVGAADLIRRDGLLRPASDARQAEAFERVARERPDQATWLSSAASVERFPAVAAPHGALWNGTAMVVETAAFVRRLLDRARHNGAELRTGAVLMGWEEDQDAIRVRFRSDGAGARVTTHRLLLAVGREYVDFPELVRLRLHAVKGQLVRVRRPAPLIDLPHLAGRGYVLVESDSLVLGSSYEHRFCDLDPNPDQTRAILATTSEMVPALADADVLEERTGVRVTVPGIRLPMVGPLPDQPRVWLFTGLGSKGLLMAPLVGRQLTNYLHDPTRIPRDIRVRPLK